MVFNYGWAPQRFGARRGKGRRHAGIDLGTAGRKGVPVGCPLDGFRVASVRRRGGYGNTVDLVSLDGTKMMRFAHLANPLPKHLKPGMIVNQGDWLGDVGNTGGNYAIHLHFEYRIKQGNNFVPVNPFNNRYHTFCQQDFERSTQMAYASRSAVRSGKGFENRAVASSATEPTSTTRTSAPVSATTSSSRTQSVATTRHRPQNPVGKISTPRTDVPHEQRVRNDTVEAQRTRPQPTWTLDRGFNQPTWWERHAPEFLGGWSKKELQEAEERRKLDEEVFLGVMRRDMIEAGLTEADISKLKTHVQAKMASGDVCDFLNRKGVPVNFNDLYDDKEKAKLARDFFLRKNVETANRRRMG